MKSFFSFLFALTLLFVAAAPASASLKSAVAFNNLSSVQGVATDSAVYNTTGYGKKHVQVNGVYQGGVFGNFSGTVTALCGSTASGPWVTCTGGTGATDVSATTNKSLYWEDLSPFVKLQWTRTKHRIRALIRYSD